MVQDEIKIHTVQTSAQENMDEDTRTHKHHLREEENAGGISPCFFLCYQVHFDCWILSRVLFQPSEPHQFWSLALIAMLIDDMDFSLMFWSDQTK